MKFPPIMLAVVFAFSTVQSSHGAGGMNDGDLTANFNVSAPTTVPGKTLKAGTYSIRVVDHLSDRVLLQIEDSKGKSQTRFLAVPNSSLPHGMTSGPISYAEVKRGSGSLRGFSFPGGSTVEFVYPKAQAADIAQVNSASVLAIDPASEGRPAAAKLSKDDMELVTLWTLSPTRVGSKNAPVAGIQAQRYEAVHADVPPSNEVASLGTLPRVPTPRAFSASTYESNRAVTSSSPARVKQARRPAVLASLPHTASHFPMLFLLGLASLLMAMSLRVRRRLVNSVRA